MSMSSFLFEIDFNKAFKLAMNETPSNYIKTFVQPKKREHCDQVVD